MGAAGGQAVVRVTLFLDAIDPPAGTLGLDRDSAPVPFAGWVSLIGAIKAVTADHLDRPGHETMTTPDA